MQFFIKKVYIYYTKIDHLIILFESLNFVKVCNYIKKKYLNFNKLNIICYYGLNYICYFLLLLEFIVRMSL